MTEVKHCPPTSINSRLIPKWQRTNALHQLTIVKTFCAVNWTVHHRASSGSGLELTDTRKRVSFLTTSIYAVISWPIVLMFLRSALDLRHFCYLIIYRALVRS